MFLAKSDRSGYIYLKLKFFISAIISIYEQCLVFKIKNIDYLRKQLYVKKLQVVEHVILT